MKVILTGSTGFIGQEVLQQCLTNNSITSIVALLRRDLPRSFKEANPKLKTVIMDDFTSYSEDIVRELQGADACIWSLGKASVSSDEEARKISFDYTLSAARALESTTMVTREVGSDDGTEKRRRKSIRFVYLSGKIAERDQNVKLWYMQEPRRIRGQLETDLIDFANEHPNSFETYIVKPSMVLSTDDNGFKNFLFSSLIPTVKVDVLAKVMVDLAVEGNTRQTFENEDINRFGM